MPDSLRQDFFAEKFDPGESVIACIGSTLFTINLVFACDNMHLVCARARVCEGVHSIPLTIDLDCSSSRSNYYQKLSKILSQSQRCEGTARR